jgi:large subunit ribosomal protein L25
VLHVDLLRIQAGDRLTVTVPLETRGEAPGTHEGGVVEYLVHELQIEVSPANVPEKLHLNINHLELNQELTVADIEDLPEGAKVLSEPNQVLVQCIERLETPEEDEGMVGTAEPEVIGQKDDAEGEGGSDD